MRESKWNSRSSTAHIPITSHLIRTISSLAKTGYCKIRLRLPSNPPDKPFRLQHETLAIELPTSNALGTKGTSDFRYIIKHISPNTP